MKHGEQRSSANQRGLLRGSSLCLQCKGQSVRAKRKAQTTAGRKIVEGSFKKCSKCRFVWTSRELYLTDPQLKIIGYQANFDSLELGTFLFSHSCGTTMSIHAQDFVDLYTGHIVKKRATGSKECPRYCLREDELTPCDVPCECAYIRKVAYIIQNWPKLEVLP